MDDVAADAGALTELAALLAEGGVALLTGAGISTASGIPDYRSPEALKRARKPIQYQEFLRSRAARSRYWMRSVLGYPRIAEAQPNRTHHGLVRLAEAGLAAGLITQNVDGLHRAAGHPPHIELHGALREVVCLGCGAVSARAELQALLRADHPWLAAEVAAAVADGDAAFEPPGQAELGEVCCARCSGLLKPHVVFFGENVPRERVADAMAVLDRARALVVLGSSLTVYSGLRFVHRAKALGLPVAIVTRGPTRGDADAVLKLEASVGPVVEALVERLVEAPAGTAQRAIGAARELCGAGEGR